MPAKNFQAHLDNLRSKPEHVRRRLAFWSSFGLTAIIAAFWLGSMTSFNTHAKQSVAAAVDKAGSPAQSLVAGVGAFGKDIWQLVFGAKKVQYSEVIATPGTN